MQNYKWMATIEVQVMSDPKLVLTDHDLQGLAEKISGKVAELHDPNPGVDIMFGIGRWYRK